MYAEVINVSSDTSSSTSKLSSLSTLYGSDDEDFSSPSAEVVTVLLFQRRMNLRWRQRKKQRKKKRKKQMTTEEEKEEETYDFNHMLRAAVLTGLTILIDAAAAALGELCLAALTDICSDFVATAVGTKFLLRCG
ncbi:hypothetical protein Tco_1026484 [Tanacetum coccineum]